MESPSSQSYVVFILLRSQACAVKHKIIGQTSSRTAQSFVRCSATQHPAGVPELGCQYSPMSETNLTRVPYPADIERRLNKDQPSTRAATRNPFYTPVP